VDASRGTLRALGWVVVDASHCRHMCTRLYLSTLSPMSARVSCVASQEFLGNPDVFPMMRDSVAMAWRVHSDRDAAAAPAVAPELKMQPITLTFGTRAINFDYYSVLPTSLPASSAL
jgi:hypothetical protein